jgi:hypothetical protein
MVYCGNNIYGHSLKANGGRDAFGSHAQCYRKGYVRGYNQKVKDISSFVQKWAGRYKAHISQKLWHSDEPVPPGYQLATLSQTMGRGYALGSIALAKKLNQESKSARVPSKKPTLPLRKTKR